MRNRLNQLWQVITQTAQVWQEDNASLIAAALSYYTIFSLAPLLVIVIVVAGVFLGQSSVEAQIIGEFQSLLGEDAAGLVTTMISSFRNSENGLVATLVSIGLLLFGATNFFFQLERALNDIWNVKAQQSNSSPGGIWQFIQKRILSFAFVLGLGVLLIASLVVNSSLSAFIAFVDTEIPWIGFPLQFANILVSLTVLTLLFAMIFKYLPDATIDWQEVWVGAVVTSMLFTIGQLAIGAYLGRSTVTSTYGAAGSLAALLLWIFYSMQILLIGAEFTQVYSHKVRSSGGFGLLKDEPIQD